MVTSSAPSKLSSEIDELEEVDFITRDIAASLRDSLLPTPANVSDSASAQTTYQSDVVWGDNATSVATTSELHGIHCICVSFTAYP